MDGARKSIAKAKMLLKSDAGIPFGLVRKAASCVAMRRRVFRTHRARSCCFCREAQDAFDPEP